MFIDTELDIGPAYGWQFGPGFNTLIKPLRNRHERRKIQQDQAGHSYTLPFAKIKQQAYLEKLKAAFMVAHGAGHSFKVRDWSDYTATAAPLGTAPAGSTPVQLVKVYTFGAGSHSRIITKPKTGAVVYQNTGGGPVAKAGTLDTLTGIFTPSTTWTGGATLTWTGEFYVPVRFANDVMPMSIPSNYGAEGFAVEGSVDLVEVFGE